MKAATPPKFSDGDGYERMMGRWSRVAGEIFLDWLAPEPAMRWLDVGCGNGAFTELLFERADARQIKAIDPSEGLLKTARSRLESWPAEVLQGNAQALPFADNEFDAATMALVISFVPEPPKAVAEMARVVRPGGAVAAYIWDMEGGGFTMEPIRRGLKELGIAAPIAGAEKTGLDYLENTWRAAGLQDVETRRIDITLSFENFDDFWQSNTAIANSVGAAMNEMTPDDVERLKQNLRGMLPANRGGRISYGAFANAVKGRTPA